MNYCHATIDNKANTITIAYGTDMHLLGRTICGFDNAKYSDAKDFAPVVFKLAEDGTNLVLNNGFMTMKSATQAEDAYDAGVTFKKK